MQDEISSREFAEWQAYYRLEPFGESVTDVRLAHLMAWIGNMFSKKKIKPGDVTLRWDSAGQDDGVSVDDKVLKIFGAMAKKK